MQGTSVAVPVRDAGDALRASLAGALNTFLSAIPRIIGFVVVLIVGWIISSLLARGVEALLHAVKFNDLARRSGFADFVQKTGVKDDSAGVIASIVKWFVRLIALVVAFDTLGLPAVSNVLQQLLLWLPNLVVALVVLVVGGLAANALSQLVRGATAGAGFSNPDMLATVTKVAVWGFAVIVAVNQLGIATTLINTLLIGLVGAFSIAFGLAFGLGGRERAAQIIDTIGRNAQRAGPKLQRAAETATKSAQSMAEPASISGNGSWIQRSARDRRQVNRPGMADRRASNGSET
ncbi:MAG: small-conductance mechanosensitive ion channel [Gemmatimonadales bacterium]|nr:small-conductance mechanosensitive ion channel [Gemmatimonadales bacterium]